MKKDIAKTDQNTIDKLLDLGQKNPELLSKGLDTFNNCKDLKNQQIISEMNLRNDLDKNQKQFNATMTNMENFYNNASEIKITSEKIIDKALETDNIQMLELGVKSMLSSLQEFKSDSINHYNKQVEDEDDDFIDI